MLEAVFDQLPGLFHRDKGVVLFWEAQILYQIIAVKQGGNFEGFSRIILLLKGD